MDKMMQLILTSELIVKQLEDIKENRTQGETVALIPYVKEMEKVYNETIPELFLDSMVFNSLITPLKRIGQSINVPAKDGIEAQKRLQETYNILRPVIDFISTNMGVIDEELDKKEIAEFTPAILARDLEKIDNTMRAFIKARPTIVAVTSKEDLKDMAKDLIEKAKKSGMPESKIKEMEKRFAEACEEG